MNKLERAQKDAKFLGQMLVAAWYESSHVSEMKADVNTVLKRNGVPWGLCEDSYYGMIDEDGELLDDCDV